MPAGDSLRAKPSLRDLWALADTTANRFSVRVGCEVSRNPDPFAHQAGESDQFLAKPFDFRDQADALKDRGINR